MESNPPIPGKRKIKIQRRHHQAPSNISDTEITNQSDRGSKDSNGDEKSPKGGSGKSSEHKSIDLRDEIELLKRQKEHQTKVVSLYKESTIEAEKHTGAFNIEVKSSAKTKPKICDENEGRKDVPLKKIEIKVDESLKDFMARKLEMIELERSIEENDKTIEEKINQEKEVALKRKLEEKHRLRESEKLSDIKSGKEEVTRKIETGKESDVRDRGGTDREKEKSHKKHKHKKHKKEKKSKKSKDKDRKKQRKEDTDSEISDDNEFDTADIQQQVEKQSRTRSYSLTVKSCSADAQDKPKDKSNYSDCKKEKPETKSSASQSKPVNEEPRKEKYCVEKHGDRQELKLSPLESDKAGVVRDSNKKDYNKRSYSENSPRLSSSVESEYVDRTKTLNTRHKDGRDDRRTGSSTESSRHSSREPASSSKHSSSYENKNIGNKMPISVGKSDMKLTDPENRKASDSGKKRDYDYQSHRSDRMDRKTSGGLVGETKHKSVGHKERKRKSDESRHEAKSYRKGREDVEGKTEEIKDIRSSQKYMVERAAPERQAQSDFYKDSKKISTRHEEGSRKSIEKKQDIQSQAKGKEVIENKKVDDTQGKDSSKKDIFDVELEMEAELEKDFEVDLTNIPSWGERQKIKEIVSAPSWGERKKEKDKALFKRKEKEINRTEEEIEEEYNARLAKEIKEAMVKKGIKRPVPDKLDLSSDKKKHRKELSPISSTNEDGIKKCLTKDILIVEKGPTSIDKTKVLTATGKTDSGAGETKPEKTKQEKELNEDDKGTSNNSHDTKGKLSDEDLKDRPFRVRGTTKHVSNDDEELDFTELAVMKPKMDAKDDLKKFSFVLGGLKATSQASASSVVEASIDSKTKSSAGILVNQDPVIIDEDSCGAQSDSSLGKVASKMPMFLKLGLKISDTSAALISSGVKVENDIKKKGREEGEISDSTACSAGAQSSSDEDKDNEDEDLDNLEEGGSSGEISDSDKSSKTSSSKKKKKKKKKEKKHKKKKKKNSKEKKRSKSPKRHKHSKSRSRSRSRSRSNSPYEYDKRTGIWRKRSRSRSPERRRYSGDREPYYAYDGSRSYRDRYTRGHNFHRGNNGNRGRRSRSRDRPVPSELDLRVKIDKAKLREIAIQNAYANMKAGQGPKLDLKPEELAVLRAGGKSIDELTDFCKKIAEHEAGLSSDSDSDVASHPPSEDEDAPFINHPFKVKPPEPIMMNIRNAKQLPILSAAEKQTKGAELRLQFPVSSGTHHKVKESEWVPVQKTSASSANTTTTVAVASKASSAGSTLVETKTASTATETVSTTATTTTTSSQIARPDITTAPPTIPLAYPPPPPPPTMAGDVAQAIAAQGPTNAAAPAPPLALPAPPPPPLDSVFPEPSQVPINIGALVSERLSAMRKLQDNPHDVQALGTMYKSQAQMNKWAASKLLPGQFTGSTGVQAMSPQELAGVSKKHQAWLKKMRTIEKIEGMPGYTDRLDTLRVHLPAAPQGAQKLRCIREKLMLKPMSLQISLAV